MRLAFHNRQVLPVTVPSVIGMRGFSGLGQDTTGMTADQYAQGMQTNWAGYDSSSGDSSQSTKQIVAGALALGVTQGVQAALTTGSKLEGAFIGGLSAAAAIPGPQQPFIAAAAALALPIATMFKGCGQTCIQATQIADSSEKMLHTLFNNYFWSVWSDTNSNGWVARNPRYASEQAATLYVIDQVFNNMYAACSNPQLGAAGQRCVSERLTRGSGLDWLTKYRDPVANDTDVVPDPVQPSAVSNITGALSKLPMPLILGGLGLAALFMFSGD